MVNILNKPEDTIETKIVNALQQLAIYPDNIDLQKTVAAFEKHQIAVPIEDKNAQFLSFMCLLLSHYPKIAEDPAVKGLYNLTIDIIKQDVKQLDRYLPHAQQSLQESLQQSLKKETDSDVILVRLLLIDFLLKLDKNGQLKTHLHFASEFYNELMGQSPKTNTSPRPE